MSQRQTTYKPITFPHSVGQPVRKRLKVRFGLERPETSARAPGNERLKIIRKASFFKKRFEQARLSSEFETYFKKLKEEE